jgi:glucosamine-6-phosphate deaminase
MKIDISETKQEMGARAAKHAADAINKAIAEKGGANVILATGASQFETLKVLVTLPVDWSKVVMFHLDEYVGMPITHGASFRKYLQERFVDQVSPLKAVHFVVGDAPDPHEECKRLGRIIAQHPIDVALVGIGENAHLAFNDPPADFETEEAYLVVDLDEKCRRQQLGEGWFPTIDDVPTRAISMGIRQILKSKVIIASVPDARKAQAVKGSVEGPITPDVPSSIMQQHPDTTIYLDAQSASLLKNK